MRKITLYSIFLVLMTACAAGFAEEAAADYGIILTAYAAGSDEITIPPFIDGRPVIGIGENCFNEDSGIASVILPESVTMIGDQSFALSGLAEIQFMGAACLYIGSGAFSGTNLTHVEMPRFVNTMGEGLFDECWNLETVVLPEYLSDLPGYMFRECAIQSICLPEMCRSIGEFAFYGCTELQDVIWPEELRRIGESAFESCPALETIVFPDQLEIIEEFAFCGCESLVECVVPESVRYIADSAFEGCECLVMRVVGGSYAQGWAEAHFVAYIIEE